MKQKISILILYYSGTHEDDEDTLECVKGIEESLKRLNYSLQKIAVTKKNWRAVIKIPGDVIFNLVEDDDWILYKKVGLALEKIGRTQIGHDKKGFRYLTQKVLIKRLLKKLHISTPKYVVFTKNSEKISASRLKYPLIIKPSRQHAGIGISQRSVVSDENELKTRVEYLLKTYSGEVIAEEFIKGKEIHVSIIGNGNKLKVFPYCEIGFGGKFNKNWNVYTYKAKWDQKSWEYWDAHIVAPAKISADLHKKIKRIVLKAYRAFNCRDIARFDIRINENEKAFIVDVNMNPSINYFDKEDATLASIYALGWTYDQFIETLVKIIYKRQVPSLGVAPR